MILIGPSGRRAVRIGPRAGRSHHAPQRHQADVMSRTMRRNAWRKLWNSDRQPLKVDEPRAVSVQHHLGTRDPAVAECAVEQAAGRLCGDYAGRQLAH
jgi:hypothetical protein